MNNLNLSDLSRSDVKYEKIKYPDGQISINIDSIKTCGRDPLFIQSRMNSYEDLFYILAAKEVLSNLRPNATIDLYVPCFLAQRSDRRFASNGSFDLKIITTLINNANFNCVRIMHPHSDVLPALLDRCIVIDNSGLVDFALEGLKKYFSIKPNLHFSSLVLISPDAGAYKQAFKHAERLDMPLIASNKCRTGRDTMEIQLTGEVKGKSCVIIDDYIDGVKKSATGLLHVTRNINGYILNENVTWEDEEWGLLNPVFSEGILLSAVSFTDIVKRLKEDK